MVADVPPVSQPEAEGRSTSGGTDQGSNGDGASHTTESAWADFTEHHYREILRVAAANYRFATYDDIPWDEKFVLWRHDVDLSLNRAMRLATIEAEVGVAATYFLDVHSKLYNLFEESQSALVQEIISLGHRIGVHFDAGYYKSIDEAQLDGLVEREADVIRTIFGSPVDAMSFHNPTERHLGWRRDRYAGLVNCYSQSMRDRVAYCSDSNGYWRHARLFDVVSGATATRLQVLTHPGMWQESPMPPRSRVFRAAYGRAKALMEFYDSTMDVNGRSNVSDMPPELVALRQVLGRDFSIIDVLWSEGRVATLLYELARLAGEHGDGVDSGKSPVAAAVDLLGSGRTDVEAIVRTCSDVARAIVSGRTR